MILLIKLARLILNCRDISAILTKMAKFGLGTLVPISVGTENTVQTWCGKEEAVDIGSVMTCS